MLVNRVHKPYVCRICGNATGIKVCKCQRAYYCSKNCQKIDWKSHKTDCYKLVDHPNASKVSSFSNNGLITSNQTASQSAVQQHQQFCESNTQTQTHIHEERRQYDPTPLQYQENVTTNTATLPSTIDDFEENLLNSLMYSVDESTEREILKNLNIRADELLTACNLDSENSSSLDGQPFTATDDQLFDEQIFEQIQESEGFNYQPVQQQLLQETRDTLEKELSLFREINLHEPQQNLDGDEGSNSVIMLSQKNPKYINHARLDDHLLYK
jgi:MYND finger